MLTSALVGTLIATLGTPGAHAASAAVAAFAPPVVPAATTDWTELATLVDAAGQPGDGFGAAVVLGQGLVVVGAPAADGAVADSGAVFVFAWDGSGWCPIQTLAPADGQFGDGFGSSLALDGTVLVVGTPGADGSAPFSGAAYVYRHGPSGWTLEQRLSASDGLTGDGFGDAVALGGGSLVVGAGNAGTVGVGPGAAYRFTFDGSTWKEVQILAASNAQAFDRFGEALSLFDDVLLVGAPGATGLAGDTGTAVVFRWNGSTFAEEHVLFASDGQAFDVFGAAVAAGDDLLLVGATSADTALLDSGAAYIFRWDGAGWVEEVKLVAADGRPFDAFGASVALGDGLALTGASRVFGGSGSAYVHRWDGSDWVQDSELLPAGATPTQAPDRFGSAVALLGGTALVGARSGDGVASATGTAHLFVLPTWTDLANGLTGSHGLPVLSGDGTLVADSTLSLALGNALENTGAFLCLGLALLNAPFKQGLLLPDISPGAGGLLLPLSTDAAGGIQLGAIWPPGVPSDVSIFAQYWIVDAAGPAGFAASNGLQGVTP